MSCGVVGGREGKGGEGKEERRVKGGEKGGEESKWW